MPRVGTAPRAVLEECRVQITEYGELHQLGTRLRRVRSPMHTRTSTAHYPRPILDPDLGAFLDSVLCSVLRAQHPSPLHPCHPVPSRAPLVRLGVRLRLALLTEEGVAKPRPTLMPSSVLRNLYSVIFPLYPCPLVGFAHAHFCTDIATDRPPSSTLSSTLPSILDAALDAFLDSARPPSSSIPSTHLPTGLLQLKSPHAQALGFRPYPRGRARPTG